MIWVVVLLISALIYVARKYRKLKSSQIVRDTNARIEAQEFYARELERFRQDDLKMARENAFAWAQNEFDAWKAAYTKSERADAVKKSRAVNNGLISEQFAPFLEGWPFNPKDCSFLGKPVDYVVFDGLDAGELKQVVFVDVKTGQAQMSQRQRQVRDAVGFGNVRFEVFRPQEGSPN